jgi:hypothetical protein
MIAAFRPAGKRVQRCGNIIIYYPDVKNQALFGLSMG